MFESLVSELQRMESLSLGSAEDKHRDQIQTQGQVTRTKTTGAWPLLFWLFGLAQWTGKSKEKKCDRRRAGKGRSDMMMMNE